MAVSLHETPQIPKPPSIQERLMNSLRTRLFPDYYKDPLTGLGNRAAFELELSRKIVQEPGQIGVFEIDLDDVKKRNDTEGHEGGNVYIRKGGASLVQAGLEGINESVRTKQSKDPRYADRELDSVHFFKRGILARRTRRSQLTSVFRVGGDEFYVIASGIQKPEDLVKIEERMYANLKKNKVAAAIGSAMHEVGMSDEQLLALADERMYAVKEPRKQARLKEEIRALPVAKQAVYHLTELGDKIHGIQKRFR